MFILVIILLVLLMIFAPGLLYVLTIIFGSFVILYGIYIIWRIAHKRVTDYYGGR